MSFACSVVLAASAWAINTSPVGIAGPDGWTVLAPSPDSIVVYVSSTQGSDSNDGLSPATPVRTIAHGKTLLRWGKPDWILLRKGDTWTNEALGAWGISGRSPAEPLVLSTYGTGPRPVIAYSSGSGLAYTGTAQQHDIAIVGVHIQRASDPPKDSIRWLGPVTNLLFEDCLFEGPVLLQAPKFGDIKNVAMRRCLIVDAYNPVKCQGLFIQRAVGILLEDNIFDNNGYLDPLGTIGASLVVNHNVYVQKDCEDFVARGNISMRAPSHGLQARVGGLIDNNLFINNAMALVVGNGKGVAKVVNNVALDGKDIPRSGAETLYRAWGIELTDILPENGAIVEGNIIAREYSAQPYPVGYLLSNTVKNTLVFKNIAFAWRRPFSLGSTPGTGLADITVAENLFQTTDTDRELVEVRHSAQLATYVSFSSNVYHGAAQPQSKWFLVDASQYLDPVGWTALSTETTPHVNEVQFFDSTRSIETYQASLGYPATFQSFIQEVRKQSKDTWRPEYTAAVINDYFREGFTPLNEWAASPDTTPPFPGFILGITQVEDTIRVQYAGAFDEVGGSGLKEVRLWRRIDNGPWEATRRVRLGNGAVAGTFTYAEMTGGGTYYFALRATDLAGNAADSPADDFFPAESIVYVPLVSTRPVITLVGPDPVTMPRGSTYNDPGAIASDAEDGDISAQMVVNTSNVNTLASGEYTVTYDVTDSTGLTARTALRSVVITQVEIPPEEAPLPALPLLAIALVIAVAGGVAAHRR